MFHKRSDKLPDILFCNTQDEIDKINVVYKNSVSFQLINNAISDHLTEDDEKEIVNETKIWYGSNYDTFLDSVISEYHGESTVMKEFCVPIKGDKWSILDVNVYLDETVRTNGYVQKPYLNVHKNPALLIIWRQSQIKVYFRQFGGQHILDCTPVRIRKDWLM